MEHRAALSFEHWPVVEKRYAYLSVSDETAELLKLAGENLNVRASLSEPGASWSASSTGSIEFKMSVVGVAEAQKEVLKRRAVLAYDKVDWRRQSSVPVTQVFEGQDLQEVHQQIVSHLINLEMDYDTQVAQDTRVEIAGESMTFEEFERMVAGRAA